MKKLLLVAALIVAFLIPVAGWAEMNNVTAEGIDGNLVYKDASGNQITKWDAANREFNIPSGSKITGYALKVATIVMAVADYTLSTAQALANILIVTGSPSGQAIIAPVVSASGVSLLYTVRNTGAASVVIKAPGKTGVTIAAGKTAEVYWLTDDYVRKTADATN